ncbi:MAG: hypothetical protein ACFBWO_00790 [Paracoccaceae bacterium]
MRSFTPALVATAMLAAGTLPALAESPALTGNRVELQSMNIAATPAANPGPATTPDQVNEATRIVYRMLGRAGGETTAAGATEAPTGEATPNENWFGCKPGQTSQDNPACEQGSANIEQQPASE